jgi:peroxiredoxin
MSSARLISRLTSQWALVVWSLVCAGRSEAHEDAKRDAAIRGSEGAVFLLTLDGKPALLSDYGAPVTVLAFWATWCKPCLEELAQLEQLHQRYKGDPDVAILAISIDETEQMQAVKDQAASLKLSMPMLIDAGGKLRERLASWEKNNSTFILPFLVFVDRDFRLVREGGYEANDFVAKKSAVIELLRAGKLPTKPSSAAHSSRAASGSNKEITFRFGQSKALTEEMRSRLRENLKSNFPKASGAELDAMMSRVEEAARTGGEARLESR